MQMVKRDSIPWAMTEMDIPAEGWEMCGTDLFDQADEILAAILDILFDQEIQLTLPAPSNVTFSTYGGTSYYSGSYYYGTSFVSRLSRQEWSAAGRASQIQVRAQIEGTSDFSIQEIGLNWEG